jgi:hypothetical protein
MQHDDDKPTKLDFVLSVVAALILVLGLMVAPDEIPR